MSSQARLLCRLTCQSSSSHPSIPGCLPGTLMRTKPARSLSPQPQHRSVKLNGAGLAKVLQLRNRELHFRISADDSFKFQISNLNSQSCPNSSDVSVARST